MTSPQSSISIATQVQGMIGQVIASDLELRRASLIHCARARQRPTLWITRRLGGKLCFVRVLNQTHFSFFDWLTGESHDRSQVVADVRVRFALAPALEFPQFKVGELPAEYVPPGFVLRPTEAGPLRLQTADGRTIEVGFSEEDELDQVIADGERSNLRTYLKQPGQLRTLVGMFAEWRRVGEAAQGPAYLLHLGANPDHSVGLLLRAVNEQICGVLQMLHADAGFWKPFADQEAEFRKYHPLLGGGYILAQLEAKALLQLDDNGELVRKSGQEDWHQVDVEIQVLLDPEQPKARFRHLVPDILTQGTDYHAKFVETLRNHRDRLAKSTVPPLAGEHGGEYQLKQTAREKLLRPFFQSARVWDESVFFRISALPDRDVDLVWCRGELNGHRADLFFSVEFEVADYPAIQVTKVGSVSSLGIAVDDELLTGWWQRDADAAKLVEAYFRRQFTTLHQWQKLIQTPSQ